MRNKIRYTQRDCGMSKMDEISPKTSAFFQKVLEKTAEVLYNFRSSLLILDTTVCVGDSDAGIDPSFEDFNPTTLNIGFSCQIQDKRL